MMKLVTFPMYFECVGNRQIQLPDDVYANDEKAVWDYLESIWDDLPLPEQYEYVSGSCEPDKEAPIRIEEV